MVGVYHVGANEMQQDRILNERDSDKGQVTESTDYLQEYETAANSSAASIYETWREYHKGQCISFSLNRSIAHRSRRAWSTLPALSPNRPLWLNFELKLLRPLVETD
jgi:hypothetical protein